MEVLSDPKVGQNSMRGILQAKGALFGPPEIHQKMRAPKITVASPRDHTVNSWKILLNTREHLQQH